MREGRYQQHLVRELRRMFKGCIILKADANHLQGVPDLLVLYRDKWAALEVKESEGARVQPNQDYYVDLMNDMSFAAYIYPQNEEDVLYALQRALKPNRTARIPQRQ